MKTTMSQGETVSHTPGPWHVKPIGGERYVEADNTDWPFVCDLQRNECTTEREIAQCDANARLIAAAPDLLEACKVALSRLHHYTDGMESCDMPVKDEMAIAALESAIDRATTQKEGAK